MKATSNKNNELLQHQFNFVSLLRAITKQPQIYCHFPLILEATTELIKKEMFELFSYHSFHCSRIKEIANSSLFSRAPVLLNLSILSPFNFLFMATNNIFSLTHMTFFSTTSTLISFYCFKKHNLKKILFHAPLPISSSVCLRSLLRKSVGDQASESQ